MVFGVAMMHHQQFHNARRLKYCGSNRQDATNVVDVSQGVSVS